MLWLTPEFQSLDQVVETTQAALERSGVEEDAVAFRRLLGQIICPSQKALYTNVNAALKNEPLFRRRHKG